MGGKGDRILTYGQAEVAVRLLETTGLKIYSVPFAACERRELVPSSCKERKGGPECEEVESPKSYENITMNSVVNFTIASWCPTHPKVQTQNFARW